MCRNIRKLRVPDRLPTDGELQNASLQFIRKISGFQKPSKLNQKAFDRAVRDVTKAGRRLFEHLEVRESHHHLKAG